MIEYRNYHIKTDNLYPTLKRVEAIGRGSVHMSLRGYYSSEKVAKQAIDVYEDTRR